MDSAVRITHAGMVCSLGLDALTACAAARAGLVRAAPVRTVNPIADAAFAGQAVVGHSLPCGVTDGMVGLAKAVGLGQLALSDLARQQPFGATPSGSVSLYLALSDRHWQDRAAMALPADDEPDFDDVAVGRPSDLWQRQAAEIPARLASLAGPVLRFDDCSIVHGGHSAIAMALRAAGRDLASGRVRYAIVGTIDSCIEPSELRAAAAMDVLKTADRPVGFMAGEAAVFFAVDAQPMNKPWVMGPAAALHLLGLGEASTPADRSPEAMVGDSLAIATLQCLDQVPQTWRDSEWNVLSDLNGDPRRATEWGHCILRLQSAGRWRAHRLTCLAEAIGEVGCAAGAAALAMALHGARRGYSAPRPTLVPLSSDGGHKAAIALMH